MLVFSRSIECHTHNLHACLEVLSPNQTCRLLQGKIHDQVSEQLMPCSELPWSVTQKTEQHQGTATIVKRLGTWLAQQLHSVYRW